MSPRTTIAAKANLDALKVEYRASVQEVKKLSGQNEALKKTTQNAADAVSQANTNFNMARAGVKQTEAEINRCNQALRLAQTNWDAAGKSIDASRTAITTFGKEIGLAESRFRLATAGIKDMDTSVEGLSAKLTLLREKLDMTHPFPLSNQREVMKALDVHCGVGIAHNGIIRLTSDPNEKEYSDTAIFIADYLSQIIGSPSDLHDPDVLETIRCLIGSKMAILDGSGYIATVGQFFNERGLLYSNLYHRGVWSF